MNVLQSRDDRYIIATLFGKDDFVFSVYPKSEKHELEQNQFRSTYFYYPQDIKFTEKGMGGLYFYTPEILTLKLRELTKKHRFGMPSRCYLKRCRMRKKTATTARVRRTNATMVSLWFTMRWTKLFARWG